MSSFEGTGSRIAAIALAMMFACGVAVALGDDRAVVPQASEQSKAAKTVSEIFGGVLNQENPAQVQEAIAMLLAAAETETNTAIRWALLSEAKAAAMRIDDVARAVEAIHQTARWFQIDKDAELIETLTSMSRSARSPEACTSIANHLFDMARQKVTIKDFDAADHLLRLAAIPVSKVRDSELTKTLVNARGEVTALRREHLLYMNATSKLLEDRENTDAHLAAGRYLCFIEGDWEKGLPHLAKGSDRTIAAMAAADLAAPKAALDQYRIASSWWDLAESLPAIQQPAVRARAAHGFDVALPGLSGVAKAVAMKRLEEFGPLSKPAPDPAPTPVSAPTPTSSDQSKKLNVMADADAQKNALLGTWVVDESGITSPPINNAKFALPLKARPTEYDLEVEFTRKSGREGFGLILPVGKKQFAWYFSAQGNQWFSVAAFKGAEDENNSPRAAFPLGPNGNRYSAKIEVRKDGIKAWFEGKLILSYKTDFTNLSSPNKGFGETDFGLIAWYSVVTFHRIEMTEVGK